MDEALEKAIDDAGRSDVFCLMAAYGWSPYDLIAKWMWWQAVHEVNEMKKKTA